MRQAKIDSAKKHFAAIGVDYAKSSLGQTREESSDCLAN